MRNIDAATNAVLDGRSRQEVWFIEAEFRTATIYFWSGAGRLTWRGQVWGNGFGARDGAVLGLQMAPETAATEATGMKAQLSGLPSDLLEYCIDQLRICKRFRMWLGFLDSTGQLVGEPIPRFRGWIDAAQIQESGGLSDISLAIENELRRFKIPTNRMLTLEDQQIDFPADTGLRNMSAAANWKGTWGALQVGAAAPGGIGGGVADYMTSKVHSQ